MCDNNTYNIIVSIPKKNVIPMNFKNHNALCYQPLIQDYVDVVVIHDF